MLRKSFRPEGKGFVFFEQIFTPRFLEKFFFFQVPWFCGHFRRCWDPPGNRWALEQAKFNLANKYFLVGLTEDLETFIDLMEMSLPRFFKVCISRMIFSKNTLRR